MNLNCSILSSKQLLAKAETLETEIFPKQGGQDAQNFTGAASTASSSSMKKHHDSLSSRKEEENMYVFTKTLQHLVRRQRLALLAYQLVMGIGTLLCYALLCLHLVSQAYPFYLHPNSSVSVLATVVEVNGESTKKESTEGTATGMAARGSEEGFVIEQVVEMSVQGTDEERKQSDVIISLVKNKNERKNENSNGASSLYHFHEPTECNTHCDAVTCNSGRDFEYLYMLGGLLSTLVGIHLLLRHAMRIDSSVEIYIEGVNAQLRHTFGFAHRAHPRIPHADEKQTNNNPSFGVGA